jgi:hypothetical protein
MRRIHGVEDILLGFEPKDAGSIPAGSVQFFLKVIANRIYSREGASLQKKHSFIGKKHAGL